MIKVEIINTKVEEFKGTSKKSGNDFCIRKQTAYLHSSSNPYPQKFTISLDDQAPYNVGFYTLSDDSFEIDRNYGGLSIKPYLIPIVEKTAITPSSSSFVKS